VWVILISDLETPLLPVMADGAAVSTAADAGRTLGIYAIWQ